MKKLFLAFLLLFVTTILLADDPPPPPPSLINDQYQFDVVEEHAVPLTTKWVFMVDTSSSMRGVFSKARRGFAEATRCPQDQLEFAVISFANFETLLDWRWATPESLAGADQWIHSENTERLSAHVLSYGVKAFQLALQQDRKELTIVLITDGGFTEACSRWRSAHNFSAFDPIREAIRAGQAWRINRGLNPAIIAAVGVENIDFTAGSKPPDEICQRFLREIGHDNHGGYYLIRNKD